MWLRAAVAGAALCGTLAGALPPAAGQQLPAPLPGQLPTSPPSGLEEEAFPPPAGRPEERVQREPQWALVPMLSVSERYDTNVFFIPNGPKLRDYVTTIVPELKLEQHGRYIKGDLIGGATISRYARNPRLNFIGWQGAGALNLDGLVRQLSRRLGLEVNDFIRYSPVPQPFVGPQVGNVPSPVLVQGIQTIRTEQFFNSGSAKGSYALTPTLAWTASYMNQKMRFGRRFATLPFGTFFSTEFQRVESGPELKVSPRDTVHLFYQYQHATFSQGGVGAGFVTQGGLAGWKRQLTHTLKGEVTGGALLIQQSNSVQYLGSAFLGWTGEAAKASVGYTRSVVPSFFVSGLPLLSQAVSGTFTYPLTSRLSLVGVGTFAESESVPTPILKFTSELGQGSLDYTLGRNLVASLSYAYSFFDYKLSGSKFDFNRNVVMLTLRGEWR